MVIRVSATLKRNTCMHLVFHSISTEAPNAIENRSPSCILFRKVGRFGAEWQLAQPWTSVPVAWDSVSRERRKVSM